MGVFNRDDVLGYHTDQGFFCSEHLPDNVKIQDVLTEENRDDDTIYICDECHEEV